MAKSDAEISLKVNMPPPSDFQKMLERANKIIADNKKQLEEYRKTVAEVAEGARIMEQRARATGSAEMVKTARGRFNEGWKTASTLDVREAAISKGLGGMESRLAAVQAAKDAGKITDEEAVALLAKYTEELNKASEAVGELGYALEVTKGDLFAAEDFDEMLGKFDAFKLTMQDTGGAARAFAAEMRGQADAFADEREALDASMPGYEQAVAKLMQLEKEYRGLANAADAVTGTLDTSQQKVKEALDAYDGSAEAQKKVYEAIDAGSKKAIDADKKLQSIAEQRGLNEQKRAADAEKAAQKEAEAAAKRAKAEEERARKEEEARQLKEQREAEAAAKREAREEEMAKRDAERMERERYQMKISALSKQELIKELDNLRKAREAASKADDSETYAKRTREFNMAREQMERTNAALNIQRMMFMQQAQSVKRMSQNIGELGEKIGNIGEAARNGELDMVGMAEGVGELVSQFQAGIGPMGIFLSALQAVQSGVNQWQKLNRELEALDKARTQQLENVTKSYQQVIAVMEQAESQKAIEQKVNQIKTLYSDLNKEIQNTKDLTQEVLAAEERRHGLVEEEIEFKRRMRKAELETSLMKGDITREQYELAMLDIDENAAITSARRNVRKAEQKRDAAESVTRAATGARLLAEETKRDVDEEWQKYEKGPTIEELEEWEKIQEAQAKEQAEARKAYEAEQQKYGSFLERFGVNPLDWVGRGFAEGFAALAEAEGVSEMERKRLGKVLRRYTNAKLALNKTDETIKRKTGGVGARSYKKSYAAAKGRKESSDSAYADLVKQEEDAYTQLEIAKEELEIAEERATATSKRATETTRAKKEQMDVRKKKAEQDAKHSDALGELAQAVEEMSDEELEDVLSKAKRGSSKYKAGTAKGDYYRQRLQIARTERSQRKRDAKSAGYVEWLQGAGQRAFSDGRGTTAEINKLLDIYEKAKQTTTKQDDELSRALLMMIDLERVKNKKQREKIRAIQNNLGR